MIRVLPPSGVAVMPYVLGLSYGAVALVLDALGYPLSKSAVYSAVQAAGERLPGPRRAFLSGTGRGRSLY